MEGMKKQEESKIKLRESERKLRYIWL